MSRAVRMVLPAGLDDPARPSGGNRYDRRICAELTSRGWPVTEHLVEPGDLGPLLAGFPDGELVVLDGLISNDRGVLVAAADRLRLVVLVHLPLGLGPSGRDAQPDEAAVLAACVGVIVTSSWTRQWLLSHYRLDPQRITVAEPGADPAPLAIGTDAGTRLLCVAAVAAHKGHDILVGALAELDDRDWTCHCVGPLDRASGFVAAIDGRLRTQGLAGRLTLTGAADPAEVARAYAGADLLVLPSRGETYGMVVTEALARGLPVVASDVGGVPEALGVDRSGRHPGLLVPAGDHRALAAALRTWLDDADLRARLRRSARQRRAGLAGWDRTADRFAYALSESVNQSRRPSVSIPW